MFSQDQINKAVMYAQQDPTGLANIIKDIDEYVRSDKKQVLGFSVHVGEVDVVGTVNETAKTIAITVPNGTTVTALVAKFAISKYATLKVSSTAQVSGTTPNDFTSPVTYIVTAKDGTTQNYVATVTVSA